MKEERFCHHFLFFCRIILESHKNGVFYSGSFDQQKLFARIPKKGSFLSVYRKLTRRSLFLSQTRTEIISALKSFTFFVLIARLNIDALDTGFALFFLMFVSVTPRGRKFNSFLSFFAPVTTCDAMETHLPPSCVKTISFILPVPTYIHLVSFSVFVL